ncbi:SOS response-associated peptidase family protein [Anaerotignum sp.]|uniref:SOS response-associated peptidase family protein n=1 Tax=Anaerotignum sp. TaxID=2039241 RepID=UPI0027146F97|nr:SOS response-associated peptidase family protein [Anaerotignum sp.]
MGEIHRKTPNIELPEILRPSNEIPYLLVSNEGKTTATVGHWGFQIQNGKLIYNARQETALSKKLFQSCFEHGRCIVPAHSFFEWDQNHHCFEFSMNNKSLLYFAALFRNQGAETQIVILTTHSRGTVEEVHHRMPLILDENELRVWLYDPSASEFLLSQGVRVLKKEYVKG